METSFQGNTDQTFDEDKSLKRTFYHVLNFICLKNCFTDRGSRNTTDHLTLIDHMWCGCWTKIGKPPYLDNLVKTERGRKPNSLLVCQQHSPTILHAFHIEERERRDPHRPRTLGRRLLGVCGRRRWRSLLGGAWTLKASQ